jgi:hypothetical protein
VWVIVGVTVALKVRVKVPVAVVVAVAVVVCVIVKVAVGNVPVELGVKVGVFVFTAGAGAAGAGADGEEDFLQACNPAKRIRTARAAVSRTRMVFPEPVIESVRIVLPFHFSYEPYLSSFFFVGNYFFRAHFPGIYVQVKRYPYSSGEAA